LTSSASSSDPSVKVTPSARVRVVSVFSALFSKPVARLGCASPFSSVTNSASYMPEKNWNWPCAYRSGS
jgi:hypothetical protein